VIAPTRRRAPRRRARPRPITLAVLVAVVGAFVLGIGLGEALHDRPAVGTNQTLVRTLRPLPLAPIAPETVTVTTSKR
jgi:hypothetical protein